MKKMKYRSKKRELDKKIRLMAKLVKESDANLSGILEALRWRLTLLKLRFRTLSSTLPNTSRSPILQFLLNIILTVEPNFCARSEYFCRGILKWTPKPSPFQTSPFCMISRKIRYHSMYKLAHDNFEQNTVFENLLKRF